MTLEPHRTKVVDGAFVSFAPHATITIGKNSFGVTNVCVIDFPERARG